jgi:hypothetical protein
VVADDTNTAASSSPDPRLTALAKQTLLMGSCVPASSSCGSNCSYSVNFTAPSFLCQERDPNRSDLGDVVSKAYVESCKTDTWDDYTWNSDRGDDYLVFEHVTNNTFLG